MQQAAGEAQQTHSVEITIKLSSDSGMLLEAGRARASGLCATGSPVYIGCMCSTGFPTGTFATIATGDGTPEMILMGHSFPIFGVLLWFHLQYTTTAVVAVRGMTRSPLVIDRFTVEQMGCTCIGFNLIHGT